MRVGRRGERERKKGGRGLWGWGAERWGKRGVKTQGVKTGLSSTNNGEAEGS